MGPNNSTPARLFFIDQKTGKQQELTDRIAELSITEADGDEVVSVGFQCQHCEHADCKRTHDGKIRCTRWSRWVEPNERSCEEYSFTLPFFLDPEQQAKTIEYFQRKQR